ncbi:MAG: thiolase family protein [Proteobacteria bacterium]|nr:thiolase family protein [Pseudomonadota bacterium]
MTNVYIVAAKRTPVGRFQGALKALGASRLGAAAVKAAVAESKVPVEAINEILMGEVLTAGVGQAPARQAAIYAGLPQHVQALTVGKVCGSGLKSVMLATQALRLNDIEIAIAGGQESMSNAPYLLPAARDGYRMGHKEVVDSMVFDGLWDPYNNMHMGLCAETCAREFSISRAEQDAFAAESYARARKAMESGAFKNEITAVEVPAGKGTQLVDTDEEPNASDLSKMPTLRAAFDKEGTITAANASKLNDGAAALVLASEAAVKKYNLKPLARIAGYATHAQDPKWFTTAPVNAIEKAAAAAQVSLTDIDLFEINEAFALVTMAAMKKLNIPHAKVNVNGGAVALGHPIGASGARILTTLVHALQARNLQRGLATLCIGGGEAVALVIDRQGC